jgi:uncharacterized membrane protein YeiH
MNTADIGGIINNLIFQAGDFFNAWKAEIIIICAFLGVVWWVISTGLNTKLENNKFLNGRR